MKNTVSTSVCFDHKTYANLINYMDSKGIRYFSQATMELINAGLRWFEMIDKERVKKYEGVVKSERRKATLAK